MISRPKTMEVLYALFLFVLSVISPMKSKKQADPNRLKTLPNVIKYQFNAPSQFADLFPDKSIDTLHIHGKLMETLILNLRHRLEAWLQELRVLKVIGILRGTGMRGLTRWRCWTNRPEDFLRTTLKTIPNSG
jgi:hypothetical protein